MQFLHSPHLEILASPQRRLWDELDQVPSGFVLYGGTAVALRLGHRQSVDFDFFGCLDLDPLNFGEGIGFLKGARIIQRERNTLSAIVERGGPVQVSFFGVPALKRLEEPEKVASNGLKVATLLDLAATKVSVVQVRGEAKDYLDIDALITAGVDLPRALAAAKAIYGASFNPQITLKALSYFDDGNLRGLPEDVKDRLATAARDVDLDCLPN
ncbi:MAG TPA: nucleotidyl transferase AbiEii/AbiGii toxin family protein [Steroidobacteraceae bacterium]|nr:nucleotidyl transferase AbiEii/AbiGii toxin family protein [Steroidobacteraceae bacterium]